MKKQLFTSYFVILLTLFMISCAGSGGGGDSSSNNIGNSSIPSLVSISLSPANPSLAAGSSRQFTATGTLSDNMTQDLTSLATWSTSNASVATISASGLASGLSAGSTTIIASSGNIAGSTVLTVIAVVSGGSPTTVGPNGGTRASSDGYAYVIIPAGALTQETAISVNTISSPASGNIGTVYDFTPDGTMFSQPVTISIKYEETELPQGISETDLKLGTYVNAQWQEVAGSTVDTNTNVVSAAVSHFSPYTILPPPQVNPRTFNLGSHRTATGIAAYPGGGVVAVGKPASGVGQTFVVKLFQNGTIDWSDTTHAGTIDGTSLAGSPIPRVAVGPNGNTFVAIATTLDENGASLGGRTELRITSFNAAGAVRSGWPVRINVNYFNDPANIMVDSSDNLYIYGLSRSSNLLDADSVRPFLRILHTGGTQIAAPTIDLTGTLTNRMVYPESIDMDSAGTLYLSALVTVISSPSDTGNGLFLLALDSSGTVTNFPKHLSNDIPSHGAPLAIGPAGNVYVLGSQLYGLNPNSSVMTGFPKDAPMPSATTVGLAGNIWTFKLVASATGNLYFAGWVYGQTGSLGDRDVFVQSLTSTGAQRTGFPVFTGASGMDHPAGSVIDSSGNYVWVLWFSDAISGTRDAFVTRFNAN